MFVDRSALRKSVVVVAISSIGFVACGGDDDGGADDGGGSPDLVAQGEDLFQANCSPCHGTDLRGTDTGPPFLDQVYAPDHHPDEAFFAAVENGVQPHHWEFGPMPPQPAVSEEDVRAIVAYVRAEQEAAGIIEGTNQ